MNTLIVENTTTGEQTKSNDAVDVLSVGGTVRWADQTGSPHSAEDARIVKASGRVKVGVQSPVNDTKRAFRDARTVTYSDEDKMVYLSGAGWVERMVGEVVRVRDEKLH